MAFRNALLAAAAVAFLSSSVGASDNGLARTPQMGWNNWNALFCDVSEELLIETGKLIVDYGLKDVGYFYVVLDDCWSAGRDANNALLPNLNKFPRGMADVANEIHALGLGFGMYSDAGKYTCGGFAGSLGFETVDAQTFADWGVDYLKYDNCYNEGQAGTQLISYTRYATMSKALNATGRPILFSLCNWGEDYPWNWGSTIANSWRITGDIYDNWDTPDVRCPCDGPNAYDCALPGFHCSAVNIMNKVASITAKSVPGGWNDLDMLEVGNGGMTDAESVAHFSLWSAVKSPLIMGNDIRRIKAADLAILSNAAVIAVNQDPWGSSAVRRWLRPVADDPNPQAALQLWSGNLYPTTSSSWGDIVVVLINGASSSTVMNAPLADIFFDAGGARSSQANSAWEVRDLWANRMSDEAAQAIIDGGAGSGNGTSGERYNATALSYREGLSQRNELLLGTVTSTVQPLGTVSATVDSHGAAMFRLRPVTSA